MGVGCVYTLAVSDSLPNRRRPHHEVIGATGRPMVVFLTCCTKGRRPILANDVMHATIVEQWKRAAAWLVGRYVIMPDHVHLFVTPGELELPLENWVTYWKRMFARVHDTGQWQEGYWDYTLRVGQSYAQKWEYVRDNPVRHGLVHRYQDWPYAGELNVFNW